MPHARLAKNLTELAMQALGLLALGAPLGMQVCYMQALEEGMTVAEMVDPA